jgi:DNA-binding transcriptional LysR family regulator
LAASKILGLNQTTVSRRVQVLESSLGLALFERDTRGHSLTAQGTALVETAKQMEAAAQNITMRAEHLGRTSSGTIRVTAAHSSMNHWVLPLLAGFQETNPNIYFETNASEAHVSLENGEADVAIRASDAIKGDTLIIRKLPNVRWGVYGNTRYVESLESPVTLKNLFDLPILNYRKEMIDAVKVFTWFTKTIDTTKTLSTVDSVVTMSLSLRSNNAVGLLPCVEGESHTNLTLCFTHEELQSGLWLVASKEAWQKPRVRNFMKYFGEAFPKDGQAVRA